MSFAIATRAELLKTKRTASVWLSVLGAGFIPALFLTIYLVKPEGSINQLRQAPWEVHFMWGWQALSSFLFPMYIILICSLIPQIEFKNNTWKQVFAAPQSAGTIFFSKFLAIHIMILFCFLLINVFMILGGVVANLINAKYSFLHHALPWKSLLRLNVKTYVSILGISAIQYVLSLRFKNFIAPIGIGLGILIGSLIAFQFGWEHISKMPYAHPLLTLKYMGHKERPFLENHEWNSIIYFVVVLLLGFFDLKLRREKG